MEEAKKRCTECGEEILAIARKCKHCGSILVAPEIAVAGGAPVVTSRAQPSAPGAVPSQAADFGIALLTIPVVSAVLMVFWVGQMNLLQSPWSTLTLLGVGTLLLTAVLSAMEASKNGMTSDRKKGTYGPFAWFILHVFLWIVAYPAYLLKRRHYGLRNLLVPGLIATVLFVGAWSIIGTLIDEQVEKVQTQLKDLGSDFEKLGRELDGLASGDTTPVPTTPGQASMSEEALRVAKEERDARTRLEVLAQNESYRLRCTVRLESMAELHGGMTKAEAREHAKTECAETPPEYLACVSTPKPDADECFQKTIPEGAD